MLKSGAFEVMVLDGEQRAALAVVRSLGAKGVRVVVASTDAHALTRASRHCSGFCLIPEHGGDAVKYAEHVDREASRLGIEHVWPMTDFSVTALLNFSKYKARIAPYTTYQSYLSAARKDYLVTLANSLGVPVPESIIADSIDEIDHAIGEIGFPAVLKPSLSKVIIGRRVHSTKVRVVSSLGEAKSYCEENAHWFGVVPIVVQQWVPGTGAGVFALSRGAGKTWFAHHRLRENPHTGGVSVLSQSAPIEPILLDYSDRLLTALDWRGVAMLEFRRSPHGEYWLMEINARFWGSLQLAVDSGLDFPWLLLQMCSGAEPGFPEQYQLKRRLRWAVGDTDRVIGVIRDPTVSKARKITEVVNYLVSSVDPRDRGEVLRLRDPRPGLVEIANWIRALGSA